MGTGTETSSGPFPGLGGCALGSMRRWTQDESFWEYSLYSSPLGANLEEIHKYPLFWQIQVKKDPPAAVVDRVPAGRCGSHF